eukprot:TRINITY_DN22808_c0_g1_i1.p1 TRINITY_DN22808_c0_g1~~TRINITY_DN22808_c0_g1_i1.p1  ORF type:complete len:471 (+),score=58.84 TRINITY_DN22808_c0_g1_i1:36-1448(+)
MSENLDHGSAGDGVSGNVAVSLVDETIDGFSCDRCGFLGSTDSDCYIEAALSKRPDVSTPDGKALADSQERYMKNLFVEHFLQELDMDRAIQYVSVSFVAGGLSGNRLELLSFDYESAVAAGCIADRVPRKVLLRIFGNSMSQLIDAAAERIVAREVGKIGLGPKIFGESDLWRMEEWFDDFAISDACELHQRLIKCSHAPLAAVIAKLHVHGEGVKEELLASRSDKSAISKTTAAIAEHWWSLAHDEIEGDAHMQKLVRPFWDKLVALAGRARELRRKGLEDCQEDLCLVHGDINPANVMVRKGAERTASVDPRDIQLIDFEYARVTVSAAEFGKLFGELSFGDFGDESTIEIEPGRWKKVAAYRDISSSNAPSLDTKRHFIANYLKERARLRSREEDPAIDDADVEQYLCSVLREEFFFGVDWAMWSIIKGASDDGQTFDHIGDVQTFIGIAERALSSYEKALEDAQH